ncbi:hypothetical protein EV714DRAFT_276196 [Schizophyllum commune]
MTSSPPPKETSGASGNSGLRRGEACTNCRHRKIRCDGVKPICGPCSQSTTGRWQECDFVPYSRTATRVLKEQIQSLEAHIEELQAAKSSADASARGQQSSSQGISLVPVGGKDSPQPSQRVWLTAFFERAHDLHFFLDIPRFRQSFQTRSPAPLPALLDVIYLWGARLSSDTAAHAYESSLLARSRQSIATASTAPDTLLQTMQARLLYGQYCYAIDKNVEGCYHITGAWSLALGTGLHRITQVNPTRSEDRERVNAFWHTADLACLWSCADGAPMPVSCTRDMTVLTPWPGAPPTPSIEGRGTIGDFFAGHEDAGVGSLALLSKAAVLLHRCTSFRVNTTGDALANEGIDMQVQTLDEVITALGQRLPPLPEEAGPLRAALLTHTTLRAAVIQLHTPLSDLNPSSRRQRAVAARAIARMASEANIARLGYLNPLMAAFWAAACHALIDELVLLRGTNPAEDVREWLGALGALEEAMKIFAPRCPIFESKLAIVRQVRVAVGI